MKKNKKISAHITLVIMTSIVSLSACNESSDDWNSQQGPAYGQKPDSVKTVNGATYHGFYGNGFMTWYFLSRSMNGGYYYNSYPYSFRNNSMVPVSTSERVGGFGRTGRFGGAGE